jgi:hypothetical protein
MMFICYIPVGRAFKDSGRSRRIVYDSFRRYTPKKDPLRYKNSRENKHFHFSSDEHRPCPKKRSYACYLANADEAERQGVPVEGVHGRWPLHILPYAHLIHWTTDFMHTANNVITGIFMSV